MTQTINTEEDETKKCKNYPNKDYGSYQECDNNYLYNQFRNNFGIMPVWVTDKFEEVTQSMYGLYFLNYNFIATF